MLSQAPTIGVPQYDAEEGLRIGGHRTVGGERVLHDLEARIGAVCDQELQPEHRLTERDRLLLRARGTADARQRQSLYAEAEQRVIDDYTVVPFSNATASAQLSLIADRRFRGPSITPYNAVDLWKVWDTSAPAH